MKWTRRGRHSQHMIADCTPRWAWNAHVRKGILRSLAAATAAPQDAPFCHQNQRAKFIHHFARRLVDAGNDDSPVGRHLAERVAQRKGRK